jgi:23S rRNA (guanosine2251-2'-O)-methyltransferase
MSDEVVYGRRAVTEARRGRRKVLKVYEAPATPDEALTKLAGSPDHQGLVAEVSPYPYADAAELLAAPEALVLALDQVTDPRNLGAVCRAAEVAGASGLVVTRHRSAPVSAAAAKASAGAVEHLPIARVRNLADWLAVAKEQGAWVYGADEGGEVVYTDADLTGKVVLVLGSEGGGLRPRVAQGCDAIISIPQAGKVGSLNVASAAAVLLFEAKRQRAA